MDDWLPRGTWVRFGLQQTPYVDFMEGIYRYRFQGNIFAGTPYGHPVLGTVAGIEAITLDDPAAIARIDASDMLGRVRELPRQLAQARRIAAAAARRHLTATPPGWADFARRNAELAARLRPSAP